MALNKAETRSAIVALSKELDVEVPANLEQMDKLELLTPILEALQGKKVDLANAGKDASNDGAGASTDEIGIKPGVGAPPPPPTLPDPPAPKGKVVATTYVVAEGKMVTTKRGNIGALEHVWPKDFAGGQTDLDHWVTHEFVIKTDHYEQQ